MFIQTEATPNPQVLKFLPGRAVLEDGGMEFPNAEAAARSPLATALFALDGVEKVYLGNDFLTVGKNEARDWSHLKAPVLAAVMDHFTSGRPTLLREDGTADETVYEGETAQVVAEIKELLDAKIRPAVAQDGGDIVFDRFNPETGMVYLHMRGACSGCPSSAMTLKAGVENMLKHYVPEVTGVEAVL
jgi:Fe-S cluster biogenesis protein NfuA